MHVEACQHIFSNVPKEQSPNKRGGYQTLFYTPDGLSRDEISILEDRAQYYGGAPEPIKWQFFILPNGKAVVSQISPLAEPDEFGRKGRYLAHNLVISATDFQKLDYCPLSLFFSNPFISDLPAAFAQGDSQTGHISTKMLQVADTWLDIALQTARKWPDDQLERLARLGWQAETLKKERQSVVVIGSREEIVSTLGVVFLLSQPTKRPLLTFDTHIHGCDWGREWPFWIWGGLDEDEASATFQVRAASHQVNANLSSETDSPFERWVARRAIPERLEYYLTYQREALQLTDFLEDRHSYLDLNGINNRLAQDFAHINVTFIEKQVLNRFPSDLSPDTVTELLADIRSDPWAYLERLHRGLTANEVAMILVALLLKNVGKPLDKRERKAIARFVKETGHPELANVLDLRSDNLAEWQKGLGSLSEDTYRESIEIALTSRVISSPQAFCPRYLKAWGEAGGRFLQPGDLEKVLRGLKKYKGQFQADELRYLWPHLTPIDQDVLVQWLHSYRGPAPGLRAALRMPEKPSRSVVDRIKSLLGL